MKKLLLTLALLAGMTGLSLADAKFEAAHPRDERGRFVEKDAKGAILGEATIVDTTKRVEFDVVSPRNEAGDPMRKSLGATEDGYIAVGPLDIVIPFKVGRVVYMFDFKGKQNLVGAETPFLTAWGKLEATVGVVTSLQGQGMPFLGGNMLLKNVLEKVVALPEDFSLGAFGGYNFRENQPTYGLKASLKIWAI